jgi:hypothetical protein
LAPYLSQGKFKAQGGQVQAWLWSHLTPAERGAEAFIGYRFNDPDDATSAYLKNWADARNLAIADTYFVPINPKHAGDSKYKEWIRNNPYDYADKREHIESAAVIYHTDFDNFVFGARLYFWHKLTGGGYEYGDAVPPDQLTLDQEDNLYLCHWLLMSDAHHQSGVNQPLLSTSTGDVVMIAERIAPRVFFQIQAVELDGWDSSTTAPSVAWTDHSVTKKNYTGEWSRAGKNWEPSENYDDDKPVIWRKGLRMPGRSRLSSLVDLSYQVSPGGLT